MEDVHDSIRKSITVPIMNRKPKAGPSLSLEEQKRLEEALDVMGLEGATKFYRQCALAFTRIVLDLHKRPQWPPAFLESKDPPIIPKSE